MKLASVFLLSTVKFLGGPLAGSSMGIGFWPTLLLTVAGMMTSVFLISGVGRRWVRHRQQQRRLRRVPMFSKRSRNIIKVFKKFGMGGIAFLTPVLLSPIGGTVIATLLGVPRRRIMLHMLWSAVLWGGILTLASARLGHLLHH
ncbi:small multi-drug export protein [Hymenobacter polaris]|nr:small multi-drug export protein [Hymenobacter polaris]